MPNASDLGKVDRRTALAVKKHIAEDRALAMLLGDHDRRSRNFLVTVDGRVYAIDRGESCLIETLEMDWEKASDEEIQQQIIAGLKRRHEVYQGRMEEMWPIIDAINQFIMDSRLVPQNPFLPPPVGDIIKMAATLMMMAAPQEVIN